MKYDKTGKDKDLTTLDYNDKVTLTGIPLAAYDYIVNGKPALDWVVERQCVKTDKDSGIVNDANDWAIETALSAGTVPARGNCEPGDDEDCEQPSGTGNRVTIYRHQLTGSLNQNGADELESPITRRASTVLLLFDLSRHNHPHCVQSQLG